MLILRSALAFFLQALVALGFALAGRADPWGSSAAWWLGWFALASVINLVVLRGLLRSEGVRLRDFYRGGPKANVDRRQDLRWALAAIVGSAPLALLPSMVLAEFIWGTGEVGTALTFQPLPRVGALALIVAFPFVHALAELPTYFGYVMPRLAKRFGSPRGAWIVCSAVLAVQHIFLPFWFDWQYIVWRGLMFLPFTLWLGFVVYRRPTTLPFLVVAHALLDLSLPFLVLQVS